MKDYGKPSYLTVIKPFLTSWVGDGVTVNPTSSANPFPKKMRAYTYDNIEGDQRLPHLDPSLPQLSADQLSAYGLFYQHIPIDTDGNWEQVDI
jgi:hypothetical protein